MRTTPFLPPRHNKIIPKNNYNQSQLWIIENLRNVCFVMFFAKKRDIEEPDKNPGLVTKILTDSDPKTWL